MAAAAGGGPGMRPNILITGTPGTGKTTFAQALAERTGLTYLSVGDLVKQHGLHEGWDAEFECHILDEDKLLDYMEDELHVGDGGYVVDYHSCEFFPERFFQLVVVLRTDNTILYDRLEARGYNAHKLQNNIEAEIMQVILEEARESYNANKVLELRSDTPEDMEENENKIAAWVQSWQPA